MTFDYSEAQHILVKLEKFFGHEAPTLVQHLEALVAAKQPDDDVQEYAGRLLNGIRIALSLEKRELDAAAREGLHNIALAQKRQIADLELIRRAVLLLEKGHLKVEREIQEKERDLLYSIKEELKQLKQNP